MTEDTHRRGQRSLFVELLDWMLAPMLLIWPVGAVLTWVVAQSLAAQPFDAALGDVARVFGGRLSQPGASLQLPDEARIWLQADESDVVTFQVVGKRGELLAGDARLSLPPPGENPGALQFRDEEVAGDRMRIASLWVRAAPGDRELMLVQVGETLGKRQQLANAIVRGITLPLLSLLPLAAVLAGLALSQGFKPMEALQQRIRSRAAEDLSPIDESDVLQEVVPLVRAINELLARHRQLADVQRQFLADAAHQLKTPLAGLRTQAELAARSLRAGELNPRELERSFAQIALSSQRAADMVNQLLALARAEGATMEREPVELAELAREVTQDFVPQALAKRIDLGFEGPPSSRLCLMGQRWQLVELLRNLIDNALRYTPTGGEVTVRVVEDGFGQVVVLEVEDNGPGIAPEARERVFQPFYRMLGTGVDGSGLGLTIAGQIAERHGARFELDDAKPRRGPDSMPGARFTLRLPAQPWPAEQEPPAPASAPADPRVATAAAAAAGAANADSKGRSAGS
ncbi:MAG: sensor histidine kinase N-terminal domain-containing protein [Inhella sp.]